MFQYPTSTLWNRKHISQETHILPLSDYNSAYTPPFIFFLVLVLVVVVVLLLLWHCGVFAGYGLHGSGVLRLLSFHKVTMASSCPALNLEDQCISLCLASHSKSFQPVWLYQQLGCCCCWHSFILLLVQVLPTRKYRSWNLRWTHPHYIYSSIGLSHQHKKLVLWIVVFRHWLVSQRWMDLDAFPGFYLWQRKGISEDSIRSTRFGMHIMLYVSAFKMYF